MNGVRLTLQRAVVNPVFTVQSRFRSFRARSRGKDPEVARNYQQKLSDVFYGTLDSEVSSLVNIGFEHTPAKVSRAKRTEQNTINRKDPELEKLSRQRQLTIPLDEVKAAWIKESGYKSIQSIASHYGIYEHLFGSAYFIPSVWLNVAYEMDVEYVMPVHHGNRITPSEAAGLPLVEFDAEEGSLWTLLLTNPDGHLTNNEAEYVHWLVGNIPAGDVIQGQVLCDYLQPFPPRGTGLHRHVFLLFKQDKEIDFSDDKREDNCCSLKNRTFSTLEFYRKHQDHMTPAGLNFFQSEWDSTVKDIYHHKLNMREPAFEYKHPDPYVAPQRRYPENLPFNIYLDKYRDKKDLAEEAFKMYFKDVDALGERPEKFKYPIVHRPQEYQPTWMKWEEAKFHLRRGKYKDVPK